MKHENDLTCACKHASYDTCLACDCNGDRVLTHDEVALLIQQSINDALTYTQKHDIDDDRLLFFTIHVLENGHTYDEMLHTHDMSYDGFDMQYVNVFCKMLRETYDKNHIDKYHMTMFGGTYCVELNDDMIIDRILHACHMFELMSDEYVLNKR